MIIKRLQFALDKTIQAFGCIIIGYAIGATFTGRQIEFPSALNILVCFISGFIMMCILQPLDKKD